MWKNWASTRPLSPRGSPPACRPAHCTNRLPPATWCWNSACSLMASPISVSATRSPTRSATSRSSCPRTRCFTRSPTCRRHLRRQPPLAVPARQRPQPLPASRCSPILSSSQIRIRSPCLRLLPRLPPLSPSNRLRCSLRHWLPLPKASLRQLPLPSQPLALLSQPAHLHSLDFPLSLHPPKRPRLQLQQHSHSPPHNRRLHRHRTPCSHSPERFNPSVHRRRHQGLLQRLRRVHLWQGR